MTYCDVYIEFKEKFCLEPYLKTDKIDKKSKLFISKLRCNNSRIPKVVGRYKNIPRNKRFCNLCNSQLLGDEYHVLLECTNEKIVKFRKKYINDYYFKHPSMAKCIELLKNEDISTLRNLGLFLKHVLILFK